MIHFRSVVVAAIAFITAVTIATGAVLSYSHPEAGLQVLGGSGLATLVILQMFGLLKNAEHLDKQDKTLANIEWQGSEDCVAIRTKKAADQILASGEAAAQKVIDAGEMAAQKVLDTAMRTARELATYKQSTGGG